MKPPILSPLGRLFAKLYVEEDRDGSCIEKEAERLEFEYQRLPIAHTERTKISPSTESHAHCSKNLSLDGISFEHDIMSGREG